MANVTHRRRRNVETPWKHEKGSKNVIDNVGDGSQSRYLFVNIRVIGSRSMKSRDKSKLSREGQADFGFRVGLRHRVWKDLDGRPERRDTGPQLSCPQGM